MKHIFKLSLLVSATFLLSACDSFQKKDPLPGERVPFLNMVTTLHCDPTLKGTTLLIPKASNNTKWPQVRGNFDRTFAPFNLSLPLQEKTKYSIGESASNIHKMLASPIILDDKLFVSDALGTVTCLDLKTQKTLWQYDAYEESAKDNKTGVSIAASADAVIITNGVGDVIALSMDGKQIWRMSVGAPIRSAPALDNARVFVTTLDNRTAAFDLKTGEVLWENQGITELSGVYGGAEPIVKDDIVIASYSSGEVFVLKADSGQILWSDSVTAALRADSISSIPHIVGNPIIDDHNHLYVASHGTRMAAFDLTTGQILWQQDVGTTQNPLLLGDALFVISNKAELVCLQKSTGKVHYVIPLPKDNDGKNHVWTSPLGVNNAVLLANTSGTVYSACAQTGALTLLYDTKESISADPIVVDEKLFVLTDHATMIVLGR